MMEINKNDCSTVMAQSSNTCYCSVPFCSNNNQHFPYLSFHDFPLDPGSRAQWVKAIRREEGNTLRVHHGSSYVCSRHFNPEDSYVTTSGRVCLKKGAVPSRFFWNNWNKEPGECSPPAVLDDTYELPVSEECAEETQPACGALRDHDYTCHPHPGNLDDAFKKMQLDIDNVTHEEQQLLVHKFCITDEDFYYYTRFPSKEVFSLFWEFIHPSDSELVYSSKTQQTTHPVQLAPIDEFFMFLCRVGAGLEEKLLSAIFQVSMSTVTHTILTWTNYLYQLLGSLPTWMSKQCVQATMPVELKMCCPELRAILYGTKIVCETAASLSKQKEHTTFKGLIAIAPCGLITFISKLYTGSMSDQEITERSNLLQLLHAGDGVMADELFLNEKMFEDVGATLINPPQNDCPQDSIEDTHPGTRTAACLRFLAERVKHRLKDYHIWDSPVPLYLAGSVSQLWVICCLMSNYGILLEFRQNVMLF